MRTTIATILITACFAGMGVATAGDKEKDKEKGKEKAPAAKKVEDSRKADAARKAEAEKKAKAIAAAGQKAGENKKAASKKSAESAKKTADPGKEAEAKRKAAYEKYVAQKKELSEKRSKADAIHRKAEESLRAADRTLAEIDSAMKRSEYEWRQFEEYYQKWRTRESANQRAKNLSEMENRKRAEADALKRAVYDLKREVDSLKSEVARLRAEDKPRPKEAPKKKGE